MCEKEKDCWRCNRASKMHLQAHAAARRTWYQLQELRHPIPSKTCAQLFVQISSFSLTLPKLPFPRTVRKLKSDDLMTSCRVVELGIFCGSLRSVLIDSWCRTNKEEKAWSSAFYPFLRLHRKMLHSSSLHVQVLLFGA